MQPLIYHLKSFSQEWMDAWIAYRKYNDELDREGYQTFKANEAMYNAWVGNGVFRGSFLDKEEAIRFIKNHGDPWGSICEGYYEYLLLETHVLGCIDSCLFNVDYAHETWFHHKCISEGEWEYVEIERPECLLGTIGFI